MILLGINVKYSDLGFNTYFSGGSNETVSIEDANFPPIFTGRKCLSE
jgi:hypothetical protein